MGCQADSETTVLKGMVGTGNEATSPAMDCNGVVASPHLYLGGFLNHISYGPQVRAPSIRLPVHNVEL